MNTPRYAAGAAKLIARHLPRATPEGLERERSVATIGRAMLARSRRRRWLGMGGALSVAAALLLVVKLAGPYWQPDQTSARVLISASPSGQGAALQAGELALPLSPRAALEAGQQIQTPADGGATLQFSTGTSMTLAGATAFRVERQGAVEHFSLQRGELSAQVAKLTHGQRFIVTTPDAEIEVRGTRFRLSVLAQSASCGVGGRTRLEVSEGVVEVRASGRVIDVKAGQHWPLDCGIEAAPGADPVALPAPTDAAAPPPKLVADATNTTTPSDEGERKRERASALAAANDLFAEGVAKRRQGDVGGALRAYEELWARFPRSALAENALVERMRLLASLGDPAKVAEAKRYLARYPKGFAVNEARGFAAEP